MKDSLNDIFKQVVISRDWKTQIVTVLDKLQCQSEDLQLSKALIDIMLKVMMIPPKQNDPSHELITVFCKVYEPLLKQASVMQQASLYALLNDHLETAFKLTTRPEPHYKTRCYQWMEAIIDVCPKVFWIDRKRRTIKAIYTHAFEQAKQANNEQALSIALKFQEVTKWCEFDDYFKVIQSNL